MTIVFMALLSALTFTVAAGLCAQNQPITVSANTQTAELISPFDYYENGEVKHTAYEQYLSLTEPTAVAVNGNYTAIADGKTLHVYDRTANQYNEYVHTEEITQLAFDDADNIYFLSELDLWKIPANELTNATLVNGISCLNFTLHDNALYYYTTLKKIKRYALEDGSVTEYTLPNTLQSNSPLTFAKGNLYCVCVDENGNSAVNEIDPDTKQITPLTTFPAPLLSMAISNNLFCAVTESGDFRAYNLGNLKGEALTDTALDETDKGGYRAIFAKGDNVYAIRGNSIRLYSTEDTAFTDFEINAASSSPHRLDGASEVFLAENKLFIADDNNDRISVYNTVEKTFEQPIPCALPDPFLSSYGKTLLVASAQEAALYSLTSKSYGNTLLQIPTEDLDGNVIGATCVYDRYYLLTDGGYCYTLTQKDGVWGYVQTQTLPYASAFTADVFGSLYVVYNDGDLYRFTEQELTTPNAIGEQILDDLPEVEKLAVDYKNNLYALHNGVLTKYLSETNYETHETYTPSYDVVKDETPLVISFAFGVEDEYTYFLYENNYLVKSAELQIPRIDPIPTGSAAERIFGADNRDFTAVTVAEDAILIEFDLSALQGATTFPYIASERCHSKTTALKIGEEGDYSILAIPTNTIGYKTYLVLNTSCTEVTDYRTAYTETKTGYLTNEISVYKYPYLNKLLTMADLPRGASVTLLGEVTKLNYDYYEIAYTVENGETVIGFIPKDYILLFDGRTPTSETVTYGNTEDDKDTVWRFTYIALGFVAIGILVDFLLLRKPKETEEN